MESASMTGRKRVLVAALVVSLIVVGSTVVALVTRNGGFMVVPAFAEGTVLEVAGGSASRISIVGDNLEVVVGTSPALTSASIVLGSDGFHRDFRAKTGTFGLRLDSASSVQAGVKRLTVVVPESGTLTLTLVGEARLILDQARLKELRLAGASSALELDASESGSIIDLVQIELDLNEVDNRSGFGGVELECGGRPSEAELFEPSLVQDQSGFTDQRQCQCATLGNDDRQTLDPCLDGRSTVEAQSKGTGLCTEIPVKSIAAEDDAR